MLKRVISLILVCFLGFFAVFSVLPVRAGAILPLGVMQSALATYVTSTGYKMWQDQGTGSDLLSSVGQLYDDFVTVMSAAGNSVPTLEELDQAGQVAVDNSGNWVYYHDAAQTFQSFADWAQSHYNIQPDNNPVEVLPSNSDILTNGQGITVRRLTYSLEVQTSASGRAYICPGVYAHDNQRGSDVFVGTSQSSEVGKSFYVTSYNGKYYTAVDLVSSSSLARTMFYYLNPSTGYYVYYSSGSGGKTFSSFYSQPPDFTFDCPVSTVSPVGINPSTLTAESTGGLALSLAQSVVDHIADSFADDDAVVIGVGAAAGTDAESLADISAQGILAGDLATDVTITAADVIDTPVQPYPDVDSLGLPGLGAALVERFPFCIPWDFVDTVKLLAADPVAPDFRFDLLPQRIRDYCHITASTEVRFNMGDEKFSKIGVFCRWGSLIGFCFGLAMLTKRMIWTA